RRAIPNPGKSKAIQLQVSFRRLIKGTRETQDTGQPVSINRVGKLGLKGVRRYKISSLQAKARCNF
ncbi:MAG: hypothetical protein NTY61_03060, partial [Candidatus Parcubacteria bacterium]|nr:hypothetical protein [Candidatus Parcubacteria bacterium]